LVNDNLTAAPDPTDADAMATNKSPLFLNETATFKNYISYEHGINGLIIDLEGAAAARTKQTLVFALATRTWSTPGKPRQRRSRFQSHPKSARANRIVSH